MNGFKKKRKVLYNKKLIIGWKNILYRPGSTALRRSKRLLVSMLCRIH